ncbi:MAG: hypothetical protein GOVbin4685_16 [Prokaryotic dsDNA virus sp.]|jgi:hypothetical protein|nr:MAG: hypothetical protein GOVbin4685_16 [Prokaryotic dsDNA virus sp.]|tara:strand:- start:5413 stop:5856 length:444 start_codon:yes stop_codon:yes gene_type:complete
MFRKLKYMAEDMISAEREDGSVKIIEPTDRDMWALAVSGSLGDIAPYVPPTPPTDEEILSDWRAKAVCKMLDLQDHLIDVGLFSDAEAKSASVGEKWRIRWEARGGVVVHRALPMLGKFAELIGLSQEQVDALPVWSPPYPLGGNDG